MSINKRRVIIDVDTGTDDYVALLLLLQADKTQLIKIEAILCTDGNASLENVCNNTIRLLEIIGRTDVPVFKGSKEQIIPRLGYRSVHGGDGFGDLKHDRKPEVSIIKNQPSAVAVRDIVINNPNQISIITVGPLTNIALAIKVFDDFVPNVKDVWIMGGNYTGRGNITKSAEFNFFKDPEAAHIVLKSFTCPIYILPWETCYMTQIPIEWYYTQLGNKTPALDLLTRAYQAIYSADRKHWLPCDAFLAAAFLNPEVVTKKNAYHATVELNGTHTRGQVILDHLKQNKPNVTIFEEINEEAFKNIALKLTGF